jgi:hypothetical protein
VQIDDTWVTHAVFDVQADLTPLRGW